METIEEKFVFWCPLQKSEDLVDPTTGERIMRLGGIALELLKRGFIVGVCGRRLELLQEVEAEWKSWLLSPAASSRVATGTAAAAETAAVASGMAAVCQGSRNGLFPLEGRLCRRVAFQLQSDGLRRAAGLWRRDTL